MRVEVESICSNVGSWVGWPVFTWHPRGNKVSCGLSSEVALFEPTEPLMEEWEADFSWDFSVMFYI